METEVPLKWSVIDNKVTYIKQLLSGQLLQFCHRK